MNTNNYLRVIREDGILRAGKNVPKGTVITDASPGERRVWKRFGEVQEIAAIDPKITKIAKPEDETELDPETSGETGAKSKGKSGK